MKTLAIIFALLAAFFQIFIVKYCPANTQGKGENCQETVTENEKNSTIFLWPYSHFQCNFYQRFSFCKFINYLLLHSVLDDKKIFYSILLCSYNICINVECVVYPNK